MKQLIIVLLLAALPQMAFAKWQYTSKRDKMRDTTIQFAELNSTNSVKFDFPYTGGSRLSIILRNMNNEPDVILYISRGQFSCYSNDCNISVKFDTDTVDTFNAVESSNGISSHIFLSTPRVFTNRLIQSKRLMIEATFFNQGSYQFIFNTSGLKWSLPEPVNSDE